MEQHYVDALRTEDNKIIKDLYLRHRAEFFGFSRKYRLPDYDCADIYQEAFLAIRKHALSGKLYAVKSSFKTYLFGIGKFLIYDKYKSDASKRTYEADIPIKELSYENVPVEISPELTEEQKLLRHSFKRLGKSCQQMLTLSFYRGLTNEEIAKNYGYDSEAVVRSQKSRCLKTLKNLIKTSPR